MAAPNGERGGVTATVAVAGVVAACAAALGVAGPLASDGRALPGTNRVTLMVHPTTIAGLQSALLFGTVSSGRADEEVTIQAKDCGQRGWANATAILTHAGGTYNLELNRGVTTVIRARWKGAQSAATTIRQRVRVEFAQLRSGKFSASAVARASLWRRQMLIQRRQGGAWRLLKTVRLSDSSAPPGAPLVWNTATFRVKVPRGSLLRAVLPRQQARPCLLGGTSRTVRT